MKIEQTGEFKKSVIIEGSVDYIDKAPVRKVEGKEMTTYQFRVQTEFEQTTTETHRTTVYCNYYVRKKDDRKRGSEVLISSLTPRERIICFGNASVHAAYASEGTKKRIPLTMNVSSFILPDRINALIAGLTECEETVVQMEDESAFEIEEKAKKRSASRHQRSPKTTKAKNKGKEKKYAFD